MCLIMDLPQDMCYNSDKQEGYKMARLIRPTWAIRCVQSGCKCLFEVAQGEDGKQQEVVCPKCGEHYVYPIKDDEDHQ